MTDTQTFMTAFWQQAGVTKPIIQRRLDLLECRRYCEAYEVSADVTEAVAVAETARHFRLTAAETRVLARLLRQPEPVLNLPEGEEF